MENQRHYPNDEITVVWKPEICIHAALCAKGLPDVFKPREKPWINPEGASPQAIMDQIDRCPSKALSYFKNQNQPDVHE